MKTATLNAACILLAVICLSDETEKKKDVASFREAVEWFGKGPHAITSDGAFSAIKKRAENCNLTQAEAIAEMTALAREYRKLSEDFSEGVTDRRRVNEEMRTRRVLSLIAGFSDHSALPLFEEMTGASNGSTRVYAVRAYIQVAGVDSVPFLKKMLNTVLSAPHERKDVFRKFGEELKKAKAGGKDLSEQYRFLLEAVTSGREQHCMVDEILCEMLPNYRTSVQREVFAEQLLKSGNEYQKGLARNMKDEMEKTPKEKRKDFKAKGELLDPEKGK